MSISIDSEIFKALQKEADEESAKNDALRAENDNLREDYDRCIQKDRQKTFEINVLVPENRALRAENEGLIPLAKLGKWVLDMRAEHDCADLDGGDIQDKAVELGLLEGVKVTESCGENCNCAEYGDFPLTCFRLSAKAKVLDK